MALCDPFTGVPFRGLNFDQDPSKNIPPVFHYDSELQPAYFNWQDMVANDVEVKVLLADPSSAEGLGNLKALAVLIEEHDIVGYAVKRGAIRAEMARRAGAEPLDEVMNPDSYTNTILRVARSVGKNIVFNYDPRTDVTGAPADAAALHLQQVEDATRFHLIEHNVELSDPDAAAVVMGAVHSYMLGTVQAGQASLELADLSARVGELPGSVLLIQPADVYRVPALIQDGFGAPGHAHYIGPEKDRQDYVADMHITTAGIVEIR